MSWIEGLAFKGSLRGAFGDCSRLSHSSVGYGTQGSQAGIGPVCKIYALPRGPDVGADILEPSRCADFVAKVVDDLREE